MFGQASKKIPNVNSKFGTSGGSNFNSETG